ncbi:hypothetical protein HA402_000004 [Bradysia odoriphaga]|nr:hypothetical protein HA402_000004 [Bradysia odoriphaga]
MYSTNPMVTTLYDTLYPINEVPFPGVAICNNNRISYNAAVTLSKQLTDKYKSRFNATYFLENVKLLGKLYDSEAVVESEAIAFQTYLDMFESNDTLNLSNITTLMKKLSPECSDMLLRCIWRGVELPCMIKKSMNDFRLTQYGYCCTFNYVRYDYGQALKGDSYFIEETGPDSGLILLLDGSVHDYHYPLFSFKGFIVQIFNPLEYPDVPSGGVSEKLVEVGTEAFIRIDSITFITNDESRRFAPETRSCLFSNERPDTFGQNYKRSDCVVGCRIASIHSLCNCVPFFVPVIEKKNDFSSLQLAHKCTLQHSSCLTHYRAKWATFLLTLEKLPGLEKDIEDGLYCPQCLATCSETIYNVKSTALPLLAPPKNSKTILRNIVNVSDVAVIRIYHGQPETWLYKQAPAVQWYDSKKSDLTDGIFDLCAMLLFKNDFVDGRRHGTPISDFVPRDARPPSPYDEADDIGRESK